MTGLEFFLILTGATWLASQFLRLIDAIERG